MDAGLGALLALFRGARGDELLLYLVRVQLEGALLVSFRDLIVVGVGREVEEVVEGDFWALGEGDLVAQTEDFLVCEVRES